MSGLVIFFASCPATISPATIVTHFLKPHICNLSLLNLDSGEAKVQKLNLQIHTNVYRQKNSLII